MFTGAVGIVIAVSGQFANLIAKAREGGLTSKELSRLVKKLLVMFVFTFSIGLLPWSMIVVTVGSMLDQSVRNRVNRWMSGPDLFNQIAIKPEDYRNLPIEWRQALAEIQVRDDEGGEAVKQLVSRLNTRELELIGLLAENTLGGYLVMPQSPFEMKRIGALSAADLVHLEKIGIIESTNVMNNHRIYRSGDGNSDAESGKSKFVRAGAGYALVMWPAKGNEAAYLSIVRLTELGTELERALRRTTSPGILMRNNESDEGTSDSKSKFWSISREGTTEGQIFLLG